MNRRDRIRRGRRVARTYTRRGDPVLPTVAALVPRDRTLERGWLFIRRGRYRHNPWKVHITTTPRHAEAVLRTVVPVLEGHGLTWKVEPTLRGLVRSGHRWAVQRGKFITVYFRTPREGVEVAAELDAALQDRGFRGPPVPTDRPVGRSGLLWARDERCPRKRGFYRLPGEPDPFDAVWPLS